MITHTNKNNRTKYLIPKKQRSSRQLFTSIQMHRLALLLVFCLTCIYTAYATGTIKAAAAVRLNKTSLTLMEGQTAMLRLTDSPASKETTASKNTASKKTTVSKKITWKSSNKTVATVTQKGLVTAQSQGNAIIRAKTGKTTRSCKVTVTPDLSKTYEYQVKYGTVTINKLLRISDTDLVIPEMIEGCPVVELADGLFQNCEGLQSITLPSGVTAIGASTFSGCRRLREIKSNGTITSLGARAFYECNSLEQLPDLSAVETIASETFYNCDALSAVPVLPNVKAIGDYAFYGCDRLLSFFGADSLTAVGSHAFQSCTSLLAVSGCKNLQSVGDECFAGCVQLNTVSLGDRLTTLGSGCFSMCEKLGSLTLPALLPSIPDRCFYNCYSLGNLTIPPNVTRIGSQAFYNCIRLSILTITGSNITAIAPDSFTGIPLSNLQIWYRTTAPGSYLDRWLAENSAITAHPI